MMKNKKYTKTVALVAIFLVILSVILLMNRNLNNKEANDENSNYYDSFVSSVQTLNQTLAKIDENKKTDQLAVLMFDAYASIIFVNDRLELLKNNTSNPLDVDSLKNDLSLLQNYYEPLVRNQISNEHEMDFQTHNKLMEQIHLFHNELPKKYENSKKFVQQFNNAAGHIKSIVN
jgi:hypothetical protein